MHCQINGFAHVDGGTESFLNKDNSLVTSVHKDSLIEALTSHIFSSRSGLTTSIVVISNALVIGFSLSKHTIERGITTLT
jgi:hypothetical protein